MVAYLNIEGKYIHKIELLPLDLKYAYLASS